MNISIDEIRDRVAEPAKDRTIFVYCLTAGRSDFVWRIPRQLAYRAINFSGGYMACCATGPSKCKRIPGLHRRDRALALETFCSTPEEPEILANRI